MLSIVTGTLSLLSTVAPFLPTTGVVGQAIALLTSIVPEAVKLGTDLSPMIKNVISALKTNTVITSEQTDALDALELQIDSDFDSAAAAALAEDAADDKAASKNDAG